MRDVVFIEVSDGETFSKHKNLGEWVAKVRAESGKLSRVQDAEAFGFKVPAPRVLIAPILLAIGASAAAYLHLRRRSIARRLGLAAFGEGMLQRGAARGVIDGTAWLAPMFRLPLRHTGRTTARAQLLLDWSASRIRWMAAVNFVLCAVFVFIAWDTWRIERHIIGSGRSVETLKPILGYEIFVQRISDVLFVACVAFACLIARGALVPLPRSKDRPRHRLGRTALWTRRGATTALGAAIAAYVLYQPVGSAPSGGLASPRTRDKRSRPFLDIGVADGTYLNKQSGKIHSAIRGKLIDASPQENVGNLSQSSVKSDEVTDISRSSHVYAVENEAISLLIQENYYVACQLLLAALGDPPLVGRSNLRLFDLYAAIIIRQELDEEHLGDALAKAVNASGLVSAAQSFEMNQGRKTILSRDNPSSKRRRLRNPEIRVTWAMPVPLGGGRVVVRVEIPFGRA